MIDIVTAVNEMIRFGNISAIFSPVSDESFLMGENINFLSESPREALRKGNFKKVTSKRLMELKRGILFSHIVKVLESVEV